MITIERIGIDSIIELETISNMEILIKPNQHTKMVLSGILNKCADGINSNWEGKDIRVVELGANNHLEEVLFCGIIEKIYTYVENEVSQIILTAFSSTILLDKEKKSHSYQNIEKTYGQLIQETVENMGGNVEIYGSDAMQIKKPIIQYKETDWEFCKRMASHMGIPLYCNPSKNGLALQVGINAGRKPVMEIGQEYQATVKPDSSNSRMVMSYEVKCYENYKLGDLVCSPVGNIYICEKTITFEKGELFFIYKLCYYKDIYMEVLYNAQIAGMMLEGEVVITEGEKVFVKFDIDGDIGEALYPFPWTPVTGNIMYCMPERGTKVGVYFRCSDERDACAIVNLRWQENYTVSTKRTLETKYGKKILIYSGQLALRAEPIPAKKLVLELVDEERINLQSHNCLSMYSCGSIKLNAPYITVKTPTELHASRTSLSDMEEEMRVTGSRNPATGGGNVDFALDTLFTMGQEFNLLSEQGVLCGTEHIEYEDCDDALTEVAIPKSKFSIGKLVGSVLAGLVVVVAVALVAAYAASVVFSGGAMAAAAPFIVGGIAAMVGTAAVLAKANSDYKNQTNSSVLDYVGAAFLGTTAGAVAGFAIVAAPYTAQMLTQQALLMIPSTLLNPLTVSLVSGGSMLVTGGITFSNLIFTHYNVVELVSGENPLKDWMIACDETNGERNYNLLSSASFFASMAIMFMGVNYYNVMRQNANISGTWLEGNSGSVDSNKLHHIFGNPQHKFNEFLKLFNGNQRNAYNAILRAVQEYVKINNISGTFKDIVVNVNGFDITVRGAVVDGIVKIGTAFIQ